MASGTDDLFPLKRTLGELLAAHRATAGFTQKRLADAIGYARVTVATAESGHRQPAVDFWNRCDDVLAAGGDLGRLYQQLATARVRQKRVLVERDQAGRSARATVWHTLGGGRTATPESETNSTLAAPLSPRSADAFGLPASLDRAGRQPTLTGEGSRAAVLLAPIRAAITAYLRDGTPPWEPQETCRAAVEAHRRYQSADYAGSAQLLPELLTGLETGEPTLSRSMLVAASVAYLAASKLAVKAGDAQLAWLSADRAAARATLAENSTLHAAAVHQVACAFLADHRPKDAERLAVHTADSLGHAADRSPQALSVRGALFLLAAVAAAHTSRPADSTDYLLAADHLAAQLGRDDNQLWTGFGPTNVAIHRLSVAVALGRPDQALTLGAGLDTTSLPAGLIGRRCQIHLDLAEARAGQHDDPVAVLHLLEAERVAPQTFQANANAAAQRTLIDLLRRERRDLTPGLRPLAQRAGLVA